MCWYIDLPFTSVACTAVTVTLYSLLHPTSLSSCSSPPREAIDVGAVEEGWRRDAGMLWWLIKRSIHGWRWPRRGVMHARHAAPAAASGRHIAPSRSPDDLLCFAASVRRPFRSLFPACPKRVQLGYITDVQTIRLLPTDEVYSRLSTSALYNQWCSAMRNKVALPVALHQQMIRSAVQQQQQQQWSAGLQKCMTIMINITHDCPSSVYMNPRLQMTLERYYTFLDNSNSKYVAFTNSFVSGKIPIRLTTVFIIVFAENNSRHMRTLSQRLNSTIIMSIIRFITEKFRSIYVTLVKQNIDSLK